MKPMALLISHTTLFAAAVALGWGVRGEAPVAAHTPAPARPVAASTMQVGPLIAISDDGRATLRVEQQPLDWVLEEIERQSGRRIDRPVLPLQTAATAPAEAPEVSCTSTPEPRPAGDPRRVLQAIETGSEADRFEGLRQAREDGLPVAPSVLRSVFETDASERVRLAAFEALIESHGDRPEQLRPLLEAAQNQAGTALPAEARRRLEELRQAERPDPEDSQPRTGP